MASGGVSALLALPTPLISHTGDTHVRDITCPICGGCMMGDGVTTPIHCERVSILEYHDAPDCDPITCTPEPIEEDSIDLPPIESSDPPRFRGDPVRRARQANMYFFWFEDWANHSKFYSTEEECRAALEEYCRTELGI